MGLGSKEDQGMSACRNIQNFLNFAFSESKNIFQQNFSKKFSSKIFQQNFPERFYNNFVAFQDAVNKIKNGGGSNEEAKETQEDDRRQHSHYPSA